jgi:hypothetical protein
VDSSAILQRCQVLHDQSSDERDYAALESGGSLHGSLREFSVTGISRETIHVLASSNPSFKSSKIRAFPGSELNVTMSGMTLVKYQLLAQLIFHL